LSLNPSTWRFVLVVILATCTHTHGQQKGRAVGLALKGEKVKVDPSVKAYIDKIRPDVDRHAKETQDEYDALRATDVSIFASESGILDTDKYFRLTSTRRSISTRPIWRHGTEFHSLLVIYCGCIIVVHSSRKASVHLLCFPADQDRSSPVFGRERRFANANLGPGGFGMQGWEAFAEQGYHLFNVILRGGQIGREG